MRTKIFLSARFLTLFSLISIGSGSAQITFTRHNISTDLGGPYGLYGIDINRDGRIDILSASTGSGIHWWRNKGDGTFESNYIGDLEGAWYVHGADVDGDNDIDVMASSPHPAVDQIKLWINGGSNNWSAQVFPLIEAESVDAADLNGDGVMEIIGISWGSFDAGGNELVYFKNYLNGGYTKVTIDSDLLGAHDVAKGDLDKDGDLDVVASGSSIINIYFNNGSGSFSERNVVPDDGALGFDLADVDGDGDLDIVAQARNAQDVCWYENTAGLNFIRHVVDDDIGETWSVHAGDLDGDGDMDITAGSVTLNTIRAYLNDGSQRFTKVAVADYFPYARFEYPMDLDGDGDADVVGASNSTGTIAWFESIASNPTLQITSPNGGENWEVGSIHPLTWNHTGTINNVKLEFSSDGGSTWSTIVSSTPNDGSYNWTVPNAISNNCLVRVADATDGRPSDTSNGRFSIIPPPPPSAPTITSFMPNSGPVGTVVTITGSHFTGVTGVAFNGTAAAFTVMSDTEIRATVPAGTTTGKISVTSAAGIGTSTADFIVTTAGGNTVTFTPTDDAFVRFSTPADNFGSADKLRARKTSSDELNTYFKFSVSGLAGAVQSAKLCLYVAEGSVNGGSIYVVANNYLGTNTPWVESGLLWTNAPAITGSPLSSLGAVEIGQTAEFEVTAAITGNGIYSFGLKNGSPDLLEYSSKEGRNAPQLIIQTAALSMPPTITSFASTSGPVGTEVTIEGTGFTGVSVVAFNGTPATIFSVDSDTRLRALVPVDATTGKISVTNAGGTGVSAENFVVTTSEGPSTVTFNPTDDAFVRSSTPTSNFGALSNLQLRKTASLESITYLKFNVTGLSGNVQSAKLRLKVTDSSPDGGSIYTVSNNYLGTNTPWRESGLKWNNAPTITGSPVSVAGAAGLGQMVEFDVTTAITGNGVYSFVLKIRSADLLKYSSKEGADAPQLVIDTASVIAAVAKDEDLGSDFTNREDHRPAASIPGRMTLYPNHPNPFNAQTMIEYVLPEAAKVRLVIFDIAGRSLRRLVDGMQPAGYQRVVWDGRDERNVVVSSGTYFYRLEVGSETHVNKMTVVK